MVGIKARIINTGNHTAALVSLFEARAGMYGFNTGGGTGAVELFGTLFAERNMSYKVFLRNGFNIGECTLGNDHVTHFGQHFNSTHFEVRHRRTGVKSDESRNLGI